MTRTTLLAKARRLIVKVGSAVIAPAEKGLQIPRIERLALEVSDLCREGYEVILVSSGAIAAGVRKLGLAGKPATIPLKQAAAAIGQSSLLWAYERSFATHGRKVAQVLLTREDLANRHRFLNARNTLLTLLEHDVVPIINENDTVAVEEIRFGDNDTLAALVTNLVGADLLILLSDIEGLYTIDPRKDRRGTLLPLVERVTAEIEAIAGGSGGPEGTGGMASKVQAAKRAAVSGAATAILNGKRAGLLKAFLRGEEVGTLFLPRESRLTSRKHWIAYTLTPKGRIVLDKGAKAAILKGGKSLLPSGILRVEGRFAVGDAVLCVDEAGEAFAKGLINYPSAEVGQICGAKSSEIARILGYSAGDEVIHRDNLVLL